MPGRGRLLRRGLGRSGPGSRISGGSPSPILGWLPPIILGMTFAKFRPERLETALILGAGILAVYMALALGLPLLGSPPWATCPSLPRT